MMQPSPQTKYLAIPTPGRQPTFDEVANIALTGALCDLSVCVMCLTQEILDRWTRQLEDFSNSIMLLDTLNTNRATLTDWTAFLSGQTYDIVLLHGVQSELRANRLSVGYLKTLVKGVESGLVIVA